MIKPNKEMPKIMDEALQWRQCKRDCTRRNMLSPGPGGGPERWFIAWCISSRNSKHQSKSMSIRYTNTWIIWVFTLKRYLGFEKGPILLWQQWRTDVGVVENMATNRSRFSSNFIAVIQQPMCHPCQSFQHFQSLLLRPRIEHVIAYASWVLSRTEKKYSATCRELQFGPIYHSNWPQFPQMISQLTRGTSGQMAGASI